MKPKMQILLYYNQFLLSVQAYNKFSDSNFYCKIFTASFPSYLEIKMFPRASFFLDIIGDYIIHFFLI